MRVAILTGAERGFGAYCLPRLHGHSGVEVVLVLRDEGVVADRKRHWRRKLRKVAKIGVLGAINGVRMREWYGPSAMSILGIEDIAAGSARLGIDYLAVPSVGSAQTVEALRHHQVDLALSLGNRYIPRRVFDEPRLGTLNVHHELLPEFRGAQSVIWQIHEGSNRSGFTIHQVSDEIDGGAVLWREPVDIVFRATLRETVTDTYALLWHASADRLREVVINYESLRRESKAQGAGRSYTTPSIWQYLKMRRMFAKLSRERAM